MTKPRYASELASQQLLEEAARVLAKDQARLSGLPYPVYRGPTVAPMSTLTERARTLKQGFGAKPAPYTRKLESVLNRPNTGIGPQDVERQLMMLRQKQGNFNEGTMLNALHKQFGGSYSRRAKKFRQKGHQDVEGSVREASGNFGDLSRASGVLEQSSNAQLVKALKELQAQKEARREGLVGTLEQFGAQKHGHTNLANRVAQNAFNEEASSPYKRMQLLQESLGPLGSKMATGTPPDIQTQVGKDALQALRAYGVDVSKPVEEWGNARTMPATYKGKLVADLPPEILASHSTLEAINPKFKDTLYDKRKGLVQQLVTDRGVGERATEAVPERMRGAVDALEAEAKQKLKKDLAAINNKFIQANQYGSPQHMKAAEERAREISKATFSERNKLLQDAMKSELSLGHQDQLSNLRQLGLYGAHGQKEFVDTLGHLRDVNKLGSTKWANEQAENEELYKNYQNEGAWEWPHLRGQARRQALGDVFRGLENRNISLDNVANINTNYSELQKERDALRASYSSERDNYGRRLADLTRDLNTSQSVRTDLERQLGQLTAQQAAQRQAEQQRAAQLAAQQAEQLRKAQLAQQQRDAQQKAAADAEAQRLAGLKKESVKSKIQNMWANALNNSAPAPTPSPEDLRHKQIMDHWHQRQGRGVLGNSMDPIALARLSGLIGRFEDYKYPR